MESRSLLRLVRYHWAVVLVCLLLGMIGGWGVAQLMPREYTASADVFVTVTGGNNTGEIAQSTNFSQQQARNFSAIATREVVLSQVIESLDLDVTIRELRRQVSTSVGLNTSIITISATDESPERAAAIANSVATYLAEVVPALTPRVQGDSPVRLQVIESATPPTQPSSPNVPLLMVAGLLMGAVVATIVVVVRGVLDARVRSKEQVSEITGVPVLGTIAFDRRATRHPIALADPRSLRAEEYRQLRANLRFLQTGEAHKIFVITSSNPGEGKSSTSANIAAVLAASGLRTCLVEADLRRPTLSGVLDLADTAGLSNVIAGDATLDETLVPWGEHGLQVLLSGDIPPNPSELLESAAAVTTLQEIRERFDVTIIDCPPLNPVSDAAVIARIVGGVIIVAGARVLRVRDLRRAVERLAAVGAVVDGAVLNLSRTRSSARYRYEYTPHRQPAGADADAPSADAPSADESTTDEPSGEVAAAEPADLVESAERIASAEHDAADAAETEPADPHDGHITAESSADEPVADPETAVDTDANENHPDDVAEGPTPTSGPRLPRKQKKKYRQSPVSARAGTSTHDES